MTEIGLEELRENFDYFDSDGDGRLDASEFAGLMEALGVAEPGQDLLVGFKAIDTDGNGVIEFNEFAAWFNSN